MSDEETAAFPSIASAYEVLGINGPIDPAELEALVENCQNCNGQPLKAADITWRKTYGQFAEEGIRRELVVMRARFEIGGSTRRLFKASLHKVETFLYAPPLEIAEVGRTFLLTGEFVPTTKRRGVRGTGQRNQLLTVEAAREITEEFEGRIAIKESDLQPVPRPLQRLDNLRVRESSVYRHVATLDFNHQYQAFIEPPPWETFDTPPDNGVIVHFALRRIPDDVILGVIDRMQQIKRLVPVVS